MKVYFNMEAVESSGFSATWKLSGHLELGAKTTNPLARLEVPGCASTTHIQVID